jgi:hypothetical protein
LHAARPGVERAHLIRAGEFMKALAIANTYEDVIASILLLLNRRGDESASIAEHEVGHAGIVAAGAVAEVHHRLLEIFLPLAGEPRLGAFALIYTVQSEGRPRFWGVMV